MTPRNTLIVTGTDTGIGKTIFSAGLVQALEATYWKPVQSGLEDETDSQIVSRLSGRPALPEGYLLQLPASPHLSAEARGGGNRHRDAAAAGHRWRAGGRGRGRPHGAAEPA